MSDKNEEKTKRREKKELKARRRKPRRSASTQRNRRDDDFTVVEGGKQKRKRRSIFRVFVRLIIIAALVVGGIKLWQNWDTIAPDSFVVWFNEKMSGGQSGDGFPVELTGSSVMSMEESRDGLTLLTNSAVVLYNHKGGEIYRSQHGFSAPILKTKGRWLLLLENDGKRYSLETRGEKHVSGTTESKIIGGAVDSDGNFAIITESAEGYLSEVRVFDNKGKEKYKWYSSKLFVSDVDLSPDGKFMSISGFSAENGVLVSKILGFDLTKEEPIEIFSENDNMYFAIHYFDGGNIVAVGDLGLVVTNVSGIIKQQHSFERREILGMSAGQSSVSIVLEDLAGSESGELITYGETGDKAYNFIFEGDFRDVYKGLNSTFLLTSKNGYSFNVTGDVSNNKVDADSRLISSFGSKTIVLGLNYLKEIEFS